MTSTPPDPGHAITLAKSTNPYLTTAGYWLVGTVRPRRRHSQAASGAGRGANAGDGPARDGAGLHGRVQTGINDRGEPTANGLRIYQATRDKLAASTRQSGTTFYSGGKAWMLVVGNGDVTAQEV